MSSPNVRQIETFVYRVFSDHTGLPPETIIDQNLSLAQIVERSDKLVNSVDLMECFAKTANAVRKEFGIRIRLPAYPLDTPVSTVLTAFLEQAANVQEDATC
jgi:hypothetical protein